MLIDKKKINKEVFKKLYRYYCFKCLRVLWAIPLNILLFFFQFWSFKEYLKIFQFSTSNWKDLLGTFNIIALFQLFFIYITISRVVMKLTGRENSFSNWRVIFRQDKTDDIKVITLTPRVNRRTIIMAKLATAFTYFFGINLLIGLPLTFYLWRVAGFSIPISLSFLLLNSLIFSPVNFGLLVPFLFYLHENYSVKVMIIFFLFIFLLVTTGLFFYKSISKHLLSIFPLLMMILSLLMATIFSYLYWQDYHRKDLV